MLAGDKGQRRAAKVTENKWYKVKIKQKETNRMVQKHEGEEKTTREEKSQDTVNSERC